MRKEVPRGRCEEVARWVAAHTRATRVLDSSSPACLAAHLRAHPAAGQADWPLAVLSLVLFSHPVLDIGKCYPCPEHMK